jgi:hypothetical protein
MALLRSPLAASGSFMGRIMATGFVLTLLACAVPAVPMPEAPLPEGTAPGLRIELHTRADAVSPHALARQLGDSAGVPVRGLVLLAPRHATLTLVCADADACEQALQRLALDRELVADVQPDRRQRRPTPPSRSSSRLTDHESCTPELVGTAPTVVDRAGVAGQRDGSVGAGGRTCRAAVGLGHCAGRNRGSGARDRQVQGRRQVAARAGAGRTPRPS